MVYILVEDPSLCGVSYKFECEQKFGVMLGNPAGIRQL